MALDFPASSASPFTAPNGVIYTWNAAGYWEAKADPNDFDSDYLKLDATNGPVTGDLTLNEDLNVGDDLTVTGTSDFTGLTTHEGGVKVTGGNLGIVNTGIYQINNNLDICFKGNAVAEFFDSGTGIKCWTFGAPQDANIGFNVRSSPNVFQPTGAATQAGNQFRTYVADNAKIVNNIVSAISLDEAAALDSYYLFSGNLTTESGKGPLSTATVYYAGAVLNTDKYTAKNNYGFYSNIYNSTVGNNNFNFFAAGDAPSYFNGGIQFDLAAIGTGSSQDLKLKKYEKGTWTPVVGATRDNPLEYNVTQLDTPVYERIGNLVYISCRIQLDSVKIASDGTGNLAIFGLPFAVSAERFLSTVTCGFTGALHKVEAGLIQASQMQLMLNAAANNYTREVISATTANANALTVVQVAGMYKIA